EALSLAEMGTKELIVIAQDISKFGWDLGNKNALIELLDKLSTIDEIKWIRLLYCYPDRIDMDLIRAIADNDKINHYLDVPIQHIIPNILKAMNRNTTPEHIKSVIDDLRSTIPGIVIRTSFIAGFPGESEEDLNQLLGFIQDYPVDNAGVFTYSRE